MPSEKYHRRPACAAEQRLEICQRLWATRSALRLSIAPLAGMGTQARRHRGRAKSIIGVPPVPQNNGLKSVNSARGTRSALRLSTAPLAGTGTQARRHRGRAKSIIGVPPVPQNNDWKSANGSARQAPLLRLSIIAVGGQSRTQAGRLRYLGFGEVRSAAFWLSWFA
jgi:hypothetical protein